MVLAHCTEWRDVPVTRYKFSIDGIGWGDFMFPIELHTEFEDFAERYSNGEPISDDEMDKWAKYRISSYMDYSFTSPKLMTREDLEHASSN
jgi:hypothetical protein